MTYYTYSIETKQLTPAPNISKVGTGCTLLGPPPGAYPLAADPPPEAPAGKVYEPDGYGLRDGEWHPLWRLADEPPPAPRVYSKRKLILALAGAGLWESVRAWMAATTLDNGVNLWELFCNSQTLDEGDRDFDAMRAAAVDAGLCTAEALEGLLAGCLLEG